MAGRQTAAWSARRLVPAPVRRAASRLLSERRASTIERELALLARGSGPILVGPWLGEVGFELLYWLPFLRWFTERFDVPARRLVAVSRGGGAEAWYGSLASIRYDALSFISPSDFRNRNLDRIGTLGEQKQMASTCLDDEIVRFVRDADGRDLTVLHPATMYSLYGPYWWGHQPVSWLRRYARFERLQPPPIPLDLPETYTAVKFYFNDCFKDTPANRVFVERTVRSLAERGPVISLSTGVAVDDHGPCDPDVTAMRHIQHLLTPENNLLVQSTIVARAQRFVGTYGGFSYLAPLCGVPAASFYSEPRSFSVRHLDLVRDVLEDDGRQDLLTVEAVSGEFK
jgi:hypothetical protein